MTSLSFGPVVFGGNVFGWTVGRDEGFAVLDAFLDGGGRAIDSADSYTQFVPGNVGGESETQIGDWLAERGCRDQVEIHTKVFSKRDRPGLSARNIVLAAEDSLRRLRTDHIDLYYAHRDDPEVPQEEYARRVRLAGHVRQGAGDRCVQLQLAAAPRSPRPRRDAGPDRLHRRPGPVEPGRARHRGRAAAHPRRPRARRAARMRLWPPGSSPASTAPVRRSTRLAPQSAGQLPRPPGQRGLLSALDEVAAAHDTSVTAVSLAWLRAQPTVGAPIASARTPEQVATLLSSADLELSSEELDRLTAASQPFVA